MDINQILNLLTPIFVICIYCFPCVSLYIVGCCIRRRRSNSNLAVNVTAPQAVIVLANPRQPQGQGRLGDVQLQRPTGNVESVVIDVEKLMEISRNCADCAICLDSFNIGINSDVDDHHHDNNGGVKTLEHCGHRFHSFCIDEWITKHQNCPLCRTFIQSTTVPAQIMPLIILSNYIIQVSIDIPPLGSRGVGLLVNLTIHYLHVGGI